MKKNKKKNNNKKKIYNTPSLERIPLDNEISMVMMSPPPDPGGKMESDHFSINPFKLRKL